MDDEARLVFTETLRRASVAVEVPLTETQIEQCVRYTRLLLAFNEHTNLTRITDPAAVAVKHFADSLTVFRAVPNLPKGATVADVGTGAGFPGLVVKIARPDLTVLLIDSVAKRLTFLRDVIEDLQLSSVSTLHSRAEDAGHLPACRDHFDLVCARAVAALPILLEWCGPLVRVGGGRFVAMKAAEVDDEAESAAYAAGLLKLSVERDLSLTLPAVPGDEASAAGRRLLVYRKHAPTPVRFPRRAAEIKAKPLVNS